MIFLSAPPCLSVLRISVLAEIEKRYLTWSYTNITNFNLSTIISDVGVDVPFKRMYLSRSKLNYTAKFDIYHIIYKIDCIEL